MSRPACVRGRVEDAREFLSGHGLDVDASRRWWTAVSSGGFVGRAAGRAEVVIRIVASDRSGLVQRLLLTLTRSPMSASGGRPAVSGSSWRVSDQHESPGRTVDDRPVTVSSVKSGSSWRHGPRSLPDAEERELSPS